MLAPEMTFGRSCEAAGLRLFWLMVVGGPSRAGTIGLNPIPRSQRGPPVRYWMAPVKLFGRLNSATERSRLRAYVGNCPPFRPVGCEKLNNPSPSLIDFDQV